MKETVTYMQDIDTKIINQEIELSQSGRKQYQESKKLLTSFLNDNDKSSISILQESKQDQKPLYLDFLSSKDLTGAFKVRAGPGESIAEQIYGEKLRAEVPTPTQMDSVTKFQNNQLSNLIRKESSSFQSAEGLSYYQRSVEK